jgi:hypothetical protein
MAPRVARGASLTDRMGDDGLTRELHAETNGV